MHEWRLRSTDDAARWQPLRLRIFILIAARVLKGLHLAVRFQSFHFA